MGIYIVCVGGVFLSFRETLTGEYCIITMDRKNILKALYAYNSFCKDRKDIMSRELDIKK